MIKIMFVCHGNICRSPMAEFIMKNLVKTQGVEDMFYIESAATSNEEIGNPIYPPVRKILNDRGIDCNKKRARRMTANDYDRFDYIVCMDTQNLRNIGYITDDPQKKIHRLLDFTHTPHDVADPWYTGNFQLTEKEVEMGCEALFNFVLQRI